MSNPLLKGLKPTHPGEILREDILPALDLPKIRIAEALHVSLMTLHDILTEKQPITSNMALRIGKLTGATPESWLRMQMAYDLAVIEPTIAPVLEVIPKFVAA